MSDRATNSAKPLASLMAAVALATAGCAVNPVTGRPEVVLTSEAAEVRLGDEASKVVEQQMGLVDDPGLIAYVVAVGQRVARQSPRRTVSYRFAIVDQEAPNAFAIPGGRVYVSRGLLTLVNSEDELACVLAHEIAHVAARHHAQRQTRATTVGLLGLGPALVGALLGDSAGRVLSAPFRALGGGLIASYSREQEREADRVGQQMAAQAGMDPAAMASFFVTLERETRRRKNEPHMPSFFDTHPATPERVTAARNNARELAFASTLGVAGGQRLFLHAIDGLLVDANPRLGVFRDSRFLHPELNFTLRFPNGWTTVNTTTAVGAISEKRDASVVLEHQDKGEDPGWAAIQFVERNRKQMRFDTERAGTTRAGSLPAFRADAIADVTGGVVHLSFTWIAHEGLIYRLTGMTAGDPADRTQRTYANVVRSFRPLTDRERASIDEHRLRVVAARSGETVRALSARTGTVWDAERTAVANGMTQTAALDAGRLVKVAVRERYRGARRARPLGQNYRQEVDANPLNR